jgi:hypothetical protein
MATPFQILRAKALELTFENDQIIDHFKNIEDLFDIANFICSFIRIGVKMVETVDNEINWICSVSNFEEDFLELTGFQSTKLSFLLKRRKALDFIVQAFESLTYTKTDYNKIKNLKFKNKREGYYFKKMIKVFKPVTDFEKACVYLIKQQTSTVTKNQFDAIGMNTDFMDNAGFGENKKMLIIRNIQIPFYITRYESCGLSLFLALMTTQGGSILKNND